MALFENFPYTNLHELNLDWVINEINELKEGQVLSVNGQTGHVILYQAKDVLFPAVPETNWSLVRSTDGTTRGIMFGNDGRAYIVHGNSMEQIYSLNHQPPYPVTSVNGQTGAVSLYTDNNGTIAFPTVTNPNIEGMIIGRSINSTPVYLQINADGTAGIVAGEHSGEIYTTQDTDKNVFSIDEAGSIETGTTNKEWGVVREVNSGNIGIMFRLGETPEVYLRYQDEGFQVETLKLLTRDDIPSSSGVVSFNGETGVVTADGTTLKMGDGDTRSIADAIEGIIDDEYQMDNSMTYTERGNTATQNIPLGKYVIWKNNPYISIANISIGDTLSSSNLLSLDHGIIDNLLQTVNSQANQINTLNNEISIKLLYASQGADVDNIHGTGATGIYYIGAGVPNSPADYSTMFVISRDGGTGLASQFVEGDNGCYYRLFFGSPPAWTNWHRIQDNRTLTNKTATKEHSNISAVEASDIRQKGNVVEVYLSFTVGTAITGSTDILFSGLPEALTVTRYALLSTDTSSPKRARVEIGGTMIKNAYTNGGIQPGVYEGTLVYIAK